MSSRLTVLALAAFAGIVIVFAAFNIRLGFGAQERDCIDAKMSLVRYKTPSTISRGDYVVFVAPDKMGYRFAGHLVIKEVGAVPGDKVTIQGDKLFINGKQAGVLDVADKASQLLRVKSFDRDEIVPQGEIFVMGTKPHTYDSRYWGLLPVKNVVGNAYPVI